jgi:hypothetical protein
LPALHVTSGEDTRLAGHPTSVAPDRATLGQINAKIGEELRAFRTDEAQGEQHEIGLELGLGASLGHECGARGISRRFDVLERDGFGNELAESIVSTVRVSHP